jgi:integrase
MQNQPNQAPTPQTDSERYKVDATRRWATRHRGVSFRLSRDLTRTYFVYLNGGYEPAGHSLEEALIRQGELKRLKSVGEAPIRSTATFAEVAEEWFEHAQHRPKRALRPSTAAEYRRYLDKVLLPRFGARKIGTIQAADVERLIGELHRRGLSESTVSNHLRPLAGTLRYAKSTRVIAANPMDQVADDFKVSSNKVKPQREWTVEEIAAVIDAARRLGARKEARRSYALEIELLFHCGLRLGEMLALTQADIDFEAGVLHVRKSWGRNNTLGPPKTASSVRRVPLTPGLLQQLATKTLDLEPEEFIFAWAHGGRPISQSNFRRRAWDPAVKAAGLDDELRPSPHSARHAFASLLSSRRVSSSDLAFTLGHTTIRTTERTYVGAFGRDEREERIRQALTQGVEEAA